MSHEGYPCREFPGSEAQTRYGGHPYTPYHTYTPYNNTYRPN